MLVRSAIGHGSRLLRPCRANQQLQNLVPQANNRQISTTNVSLKRFGPIGLDVGPVPQRKNFRESILPPGWLKLIDKYPDFLPDPKNNSPMLVQRHIDDMLARRTVIEIPEFYVGTIMAVTVSDQYAETKKSRFLGICIQRSGQLMKANFTLRNVIDGMGCEIRYDLYNPLIQSIEIMRLEKRIDDSLIYLRDAPPEYSTFPEDMKPAGAELTGEVPVNKTLIKMKPWPWSRRWELYMFKGIEKLEQVPEIKAKSVWNIEENPVYSYDLAIEYRRHCTEEMVYNICKRLADHEEKVVQPRREVRAKKFLRVARSSAAATIGADNTEI